MTLPADVARCAGHQSSVFVDLGGIAPVCVDCARRDFMGLTRIVWMSPPELVDGKCPMKIPAADHG